jgi:hypothetical protein
MAFHHLGALLLTSGVRNQSILGPAAVITGLAIQYRIPEVRDHERPRALYSPSTIYRPLRQIWQDHPLTFKRFWVLLMDVYVDEDSGL